MVLKDSLGQDSYVKVKYGIGASPPHLQVPWHLVHVSLQCVCVPRVHRVGTICVPAGYDLQLGQSWVS